MTMTSVLDLLSNTFSPGDQPIVANLDQNVLKEATAKLEQYASENFGAYLGLLCQELVNEKNPTHLRYAAALAVKNVLASRDASRKDELIKRWFITDPSIRIQVKNMCLETLESVDLKACMSAAQVIAAIAEIEIPHNEWPDLMPRLMNNVSSNSTNLKMSSLQTIGYICESIDPTTLASQANAILTAVALGAKKEQENDDVRAVAMQALYNSLEFIHLNFENEQERNYIMQVVCEATQSPNEQLVVSAYQCLVRIMSLYYSKMPLYMQQALYNLTIMGMKHDNQNIALQAVEFWSTVCEVELDLEDEYDYVINTLIINEAIMQGEKPADNFKFANSALKEIVPVLLWLLTKKEEEEDEDEWNISMASATCIQLFANVCRDEIVTHVIHFVESHIRHTDWKFRDAAVMAFGSIMDGPSEKLLGPLCKSALKVLCEMIADPVIAVKDTASWTLGRLCEKLADVIDPLDMPFVVQALIYGLSDSPRVGANCAWAIMNLSDSFGNDLDPDQTTYILSPYFQGLISSLMTAGEKAGLDSNYRASVYEAVASLVSNSPLDCIPTIQKLATGVIDMLSNTVTMQAQLVGADEKRMHIELQANLCSVITSIIRRLKSDITPLADTIMQLLLTIMSNASKSSTLLEDAFLTVGAVTSALEGQFARYMDSFLPFLITALQSHEEHAMCSIAVGTIGDICRAIGVQITPFCDTLMNLLVTNIQSPILHRDVKPVIVGCFGDIALATGEGFESYLGTVMQILGAAFQSTTVEVGDGDFDTVDFFMTLRESILEALVGIVQGFKASQKTYLLNDHLVNIFLILQECYSNESRTDGISRTMVGLFGDIAEAYPPGQLKSFYSSPWIEGLIKEVRSNRHSSSASKEIARWAREMIKSQM